jgi:hypothetical protein
MANAKSLGDPEAGEAGGDAGATFENSSSFVTSAFAEPPSAAVDTRTSRRRRVKTVTLVLRLPSP